jgi:hypothetical protein
MSIGVALPSWIFAKDKKTAPLVLLALAFAGLALPILGIAFYLWRSEGYVGANQVRCLRALQPCRRMRLRRTAANLGTHSSSLFRLEMFSTARITENMCACALSRSD